MTAITITRNQSNAAASTANILPVLNRIRKEGMEEYEEMQQAFNLLGWSELPDLLKFEIYDDVKFMVQELKGHFSTCDPFVQKRRNTIHYWVSCFQDGICSLEAAIKALKIKAL